MLRPALLSVLEQTYPNIEIIFVDNNSTDGSLAIAEEIAQTTTRQFHITTCAAQGANNARNWGYGLARGEFIQWMDADDWLDPDKIALQVAALQQHSTDDIAYGGWTLRQSLASAPPTEHVIAVRASDDQIRRVLAGEFYPPIIHLFRRQAAEALQAEKAWWPDRRNSDDFEYSAIAALLGMRFRFVPEAQSVYNIWSDSQLSNVTTTERARTISDIMTRLRALATRPEIAQRLRPQHKALIEQNCDIWTMLPGSVTIMKQQGRQYELRHRRTGATLLVRPREAMVARTMQIQPAQDILRLHARYIAFRVPEFAHEHAWIIEVLERFRRAGLLDLVARVDDRGRHSQTRTPSIRRVLTYFPEP